MASEVGAPATSVQISDEAGAVESVAAPVQETPTDAYAFEYVGSSLPSVSGKDLADSWLKWGLSERLRVATFRLSAGRFDASAAEAFVQDFFNSPAVKEHFPVLDGRGNAIKLRGHVSAVRMERLQTRVISLEWWDRLVAAGAVSASGYIRKQLDADVEGLVISDHLRDALINPDSEYACQFSEEEQAEFMYRLLRWIVTGGGAMQYEDEWQPYLDACKAVYRDMLTVAKNTTTGAIEVQSYVYQIHSLAGEASTSGGAGGGSGASSDALRLFPHDNPHNVCWMAVDPLKRTVTVLCHSWEAFW